MLIYDQLLKAAQKSGKIVQAAGETDESFLLRLLKIIVTLPDSDWNNLSAEAQEWTNEAAEARNFQPPLPLPICPGFKDSIVSDQVITPSIQKPPTVLKNNLKPLKKKKGALHAIRETILLHPDWSNNQVYQHVKQTWPETRPETVAVNGSDIRHTLALAKQLGWIPPKKSEEEANEKRKEQSTTVA
jgi:hypothetical protein